MTQERYLEAAGVRDGRWFLDRHARKGLRAMAPPPIASSAAWPLDSYKVHLIYIFMTLMALRAGTPAARDPTMRGYVIDKATD